MDRFMWVGEKFVQPASPPAAEPPEPLPVAAAAGLPWQPEAGGAAVGAVGESALKRDLEELLRRHFRRPADYKATPEHWARIGGAFALWACCLAGWTAGELPATLALPFAQWLVFSPTVHESSHSTLSTTPWVNKAAAFCGLPFIYNPLHLVAAAHRLASPVHQRRRARRRPPPPAAGAPPPGERGR